MTHEQKINYMRIAASICNFGFSNEQLDLLISLYDGVLEFKGEFDIEQMAQVQADVKKRADIIHRQKLLDEISEKVD